MLRLVCHNDVQSRLKVGIMSGKSKEEIAFDLVAKLKGVGVWGENNMSEILDMYAECLEATSGLRKFKGSAAAANAEPKPFVPAQQPAQQLAQAAPLQAVTPAQHQQVLQQAMNHQPQQAVPAQAYNPQAPR
jgi:hypothetical protein